MADASSPEAGRKWAELAAKAASLRLEMEHWQLLTADTEKPFSKHQSQVGRICGRVEGSLRKVDLELNDRKTLLGRATQIQTDMLKAHAIWEFFRSKLILRADSYLGKYLRVCDEIAWACYKPAQDLFKQALPPAERETVSLQVKEPPLVFLNGVWSPYAVGREKSFSAEMAAGGWAMPGVLPRVAEKLPVPMIGLPWYQVSHLPDALVIEHEVGHVAEWDFKLEAATKSAIEAADTKVKAAWDSWRREIFADLYGVLAGGPSFVRSLVNFLLSEVATIQGEKANPNAWGQYPPAWLRIALVVEALSRAFPREASEIRTDWESKYGTPAGKADWENDMKSVVDKLLTGPYPTLGGCGLRDVISFPAEAGEAKDIAVKEQIRAGQALADTSPRVLVGAAQRLYDESPEEFVAKRLGAHVRDLIIANIPSGTRGTPPADLGAVVAAEQDLALDFSEEIPV